MAELFVAVKANVNLPGNPARRGRPTIQGALILLDGATGQPLAVMDSIALTSLRTAAVAALAAQHLSLALRAHDHHRRLRRTGRSPAARDVRGAGSATGHLPSMSTAPRPSRLPGGCRIDWVFTSNPRPILPEALRVSEICVTCTTSTTPLVYREDLHPGLFVAAVGADNPTKQEIDAERDGPQPRRRRFARRLCRQRRSLPRASRRRP